MILNIVRSSWGPYRESKNRRGQVTPYHEACVRCDRATANNRESHPMLALKYGGSTKKLLMSIACRLPDVLWYAVLIRQFAMICNPSTMNAMALTVWANPIFGKRLLDWTGGLSIVQSEIHSQQTNFITVTLQVKTLQHKKEGWKAYLSGRWQLRQNFHS